MAKGIKLTDEETQERFKAQLDKAKEALQALETRLTEIDKEREKVTAKIKDRRAEVEKYQALVKERQFSVFEEMLRTKGLNFEDVSRAIANGDTKYLLDLANLKAEEPEKPAEEIAEKTEAETPAVQNEHAEPKPEPTRPANYPPNYPPQPAASVSRMDTAGGPANPLNVMQYGQAPARTTPQGWNAAQPQQS